MPVSVVQLQSSRSKQMATRWLHALARLRETRQHPPPIALSDQMRHLAAHRLAPTAVSTAYVDQPPLTRWRVMDCVAHVALRCVAERSGALRSEALRSEVLRCDAWRGVARSRVAERWFISPPV